MPCPACATGTPAGGPLCARCAATLTPASERRLAGGVLVRSAFTHRGAARWLVHRLKYGGHPAAARVLAAGMAAVLPAEARALVPVPRSRARRWRYGVDPGVELARALGRAAGLPVVRALAPAWWHRRRAGPSGAPRGKPRFRAVAAPPSGAVLVDDVVTTGTTLEAAAAALGGVHRAITATGAPGPTALLAQEAPQCIVTPSPREGTSTSGAWVPAWNAPSLGPLLFSACLPFSARAHGPIRRSRWRFVSTARE